MKRTVVVVALILLVCLVASAQVVRSDRYTINGIGYANSAGDSATWIPIPYDGPARYGVLEGQLPDSIHVTTWGVTDTLALDMYLKYGPASSSRYVWVYIDSIKAGTVSARKLTPSTVFPGSIDRMTVVTLQRSAGAAVLAANRKLWVRVERFFTIPPK